MVSISIYLSLWSKSRFPVSIFFLAITESLEEHLKREPYPDLQVGKKYILKMKLLAISIRLNVARKDEDTLTLFQELLTRSVF